MKIRIFTRVYSTQCVPNTQGTPDLDQMGKMPRPGGHQVRWASRHEEAFGTRQHEIRLYSQSCITSPSRPLRLPRLPFLRACRTHRKALRRRWTAGDGPSLGPLPAATPAALNWPVRQLQAQEHGAGAEERLPAHQNLSPLKLLALRVS